jgi:hypothetical protein
MTALVLPPHYTAASRITTALQTSGHAVISPEGVCGLLGTDLSALARLQASWNDLPPDPHLRDGGRYRRRRHSCYVLDAQQQLAQVPHRAHWQPAHYNALHGGIERWFEPIESSTLAEPVWRQLLQSLGHICADLQGAQNWFIEAHQFRIDTTDGIGRPTPEGAHRDGVDFVAVLLVSRVGIKGGETRVFEADGPSGKRFTMTEPWTMLLLDDTRVVHESTPIQPLQDGGHRDTLVLTFRRGGFQAPESGMMA